MKRRVWTFLMLIYLATAGSFAAQEPVWNPARNAAKRASGDAAESRHRRDVWNP